MLSLLLTEAEYCCWLQVKENIVKPSFTNSADVNYPTGPGFDYNWDQTENVSYLKKLCH